MGRQFAIKQCQTCLSQNDMQLINCKQSFVMESGKEITYEDCYRECTQLEATADHLPYTICHQCAAEMRNTYAFIQRAKECNYILLTQAASLTAEITEDSEQELVGEVKDESEHEDAQCFPAQEECNQILLTQTALLTAESIEESEQELVEAEVKYESEHEYAECFPAQEDEKVTLPFEQKIVDENHKNVNEFIESWPELEEKFEISSIPEDTVRRRIRKSEAVQTRCEICDLPFTKKELRHHNKLKHNATIFLCQSCPLTFKKKAHLEGHEWTHVVRERNYKCDICGKKFLNKSNWTCHVRLHSEDRKPAFKCDYCDKAFFYKPGLRLHMQNHTGKMVECELCSKKYPRIHELKIHMRTHTGERPFKCQYCEMDFTNKCRLKVHERKHQNICYKCDFCEKEFDRESKLIKHRISHTGYPFKCAICDKGFVGSSGIRRHIKGVHKVGESEDISNFVIKVNDMSKRWKRSDQIVLLSE